MDIEEDYEANHKLGWRPDPYSRGTVPVGMCNLMCGYEEIVERQRLGRIHKYEMKPGSDPPEVDNKLVIKEFKRGCIGREFTDSENLRPWSVLRKTLHHLLLNICTKDDDWMYVCDFVFDRLKALRQDMVIQRIEGKRYVEVLEGSIRFLIYSMYMLTCTLKDYSCDVPLKPIIPLEGQVKGLNNREVHVVREMKLTMKCLRDCLRSLICQYQENSPNSHFRPLFESINLIVNLPFIPGADLCVTKFQSDKELRNKDPVFKIVFKMYSEHLAGNHWSALKRLPKLVDQPLIMLAYAPALAQLQIQLMQRIKKYCSTPSPNYASLSALCSLICPKWLEVDEDEKLNFTKLMAIQFDVYEPERNLCDFRRKKGVAVDGKLEADCEDNNETRTYALQMIAGKNWLLINEIVQLHELTTILDPTQPDSTTLI